MDYKTQQSMALTVWHESALPDVQEVVPGMEEISLLREALKQLDQPFLVVIVGEFNSGKSTVINALLGTRFLADGILPTTNEISVLKFRRGPLLVILSRWQLRSPVFSAILDECACKMHLCEISCRPGCSFCISC